MLNIAFRTFILCNWLW